MPKNEKGVSSSSERWARAAEEEAEKRANDAQLISQKDDTQLQQSWEDTQKEVQVKEEDAEEATPAILLTSCIASG